MPLSGGPLKPPAGLALRPRMLDCGMEESRQAAAVAQRPAELWQCIHNTYAPLAPLCTAPQPKAALTSSQGYSGSFSIPLSGCCCCLNCCCRCLRRRSHKRPPAAATTATTATGTATAATGKLLLLLLLGAAAYAEQLLVLRSVGEHSGLAPHSVNVAPCGGCGHSCGLPGWSPTFCRFGSCTQLGGMVPLKLLPASSLQAG